MYGVNPEGRILDNILYEVNKIRNILSGSES
jgi:hypothetical protein